MFGAHRPYIDWDPIKLAQYLVDHKRSPKECWDLVVLDPFGPTAAEKRAGCIYTIAEITSDPEVCRLLLPNEYTWSCLGSVKSKLSEGFGCGADEYISCGDYDIYVKNLGIADCSIYHEKVLQDWCHDRRTATLENIYECDLISPEPPGLREECQMRYAFKLKDAALCAPIKNNDRRRLCEIEIEVWNKYSNIWSL